MLSFSEALDKLFLDGDEWGVKSYSSIGSNEFAQTWDVSAGGWPHAWPDALRLLEPVASCDFTSAAAQNAELCLDRGPAKGTLAWIHFLESIFFQLLWYKKLPSQQKEKASHKSSRLRGPLKWKGLKAGGDFPPSVAAPGWHEQLDSPTKVTASCGQGPCRAPSRRSSWRALGLARGCTGSDRGKAETLSNFKTDLITARLCWEARCLRRKMGTRVQVFSQGLP